MARRSPSREPPTHAQQLGSVFNADAPTKYGIWSHPSIYETSIVANLVSITLYGLYNVQIVVAADSTQHDVADDERRSLDRRNCAKLARFDSAPHRASARAERYWLSGPELINVMCRPAQRLFSRGCVEFGISADFGKTDCLSREATL